MNAEKPASEGCRPPSPVVLPAPAADHRVGGETVMVVEDDANVRLLACEVLRHSGYRVMECPDPAHAIREVESAAAPIHLLLTDMVMPEMDGRELYQHLSKLLPELKVVYMSGSSVDALLEGVERRERAPFVKKPFTIQVLARAVRTALDR